MRPPTWHRFRLTGGAILIVIGFVYLPFETLNNPRWEIAAQLGSIVLALAALWLADQSLVIAHQANAQFGRQVQREEVEFANATTAAIVEAFAAWPTIMIRLHVAASLALSQGDRLKASGAMVSEGYLDSAERDGEMLSSVIGDMQDALNKVLQSTAVQDYMSWVVQHGEASTSRADYWSRVAEVVTIPERHRLRAEFGVDGNVAERVAALRHLLDWNAYELARDPGTTYIERLWDVQAWAGGAGHALGDILRDRDDDYSISSNFMLMGALLFSSWYDPFLINGSVLLYHMYWLWPEPEILRRYLEFRYGALGQAGDLGLDVADRRRAFGPRLASEFEFCAQHPEVLLHVVEPT